MGSARTGPGVLMPPLMSGALISHGVVAAPTHGACTRREQRLLTACRYHKGLLSRSANAENMMLKLTLTRSRSLRLLSTECCK